MLLYLLRLIEVTERKSYILWQSEILMKTKYTCVDYQNTLAININILNYIYWSHLSAVFFNKTFGNHDNYDLKSIFY